MKYLYLMIVVLVFASNSYAQELSGAQELKNNALEKLEGDLSVLKQEINRLNVKLTQSEQSAKIVENKLKSDLSKIENDSGKQFLKIDKELEGIEGVRSELKSDIESTNNQISSVEKSVKNISLAWAQSSNISKIGAIVLLTGLLIEIIGATVLAGTHLVTEQKEVYTLKSTPPSNDLSMTDVNSEPRIDFLGSIASFMLFSGFVLQFSGTILVLSLPAWLAFTMVALAVIPGTLVIYYLLGQSYNQSRSKKLEIILKNIKRTLIPSFSAKCEKCSKNLKFKEAYVFWSKEPASENYPYLYAPYNMHLGHQVCLAGSGKYVRSKNRNPQLTEIEHHQKTVADFLMQDAPEMKKWWIEYRKHHADRGNAREAISFSEYTFLQVLKEIDRLKPDKHLQRDQIPDPSSLQGGA